MRPVSSDVIRLATPVSDEQKTAAMDTLAQAGVSADDVKALHQTAKAEYEFSSVKAREAATIASANFMSQVLIPQMINDTMRRGLLEDADDNDLVDAAR